MVDLMTRAQRCLENMMIRKKKSEVVEKATFTSGTDLASGGLLAPQQAAKLIRLIKYPPTMLREARLVAMRGPTERIDRVTFASRILHKATEATALGAASQARPTMSKLELTAKEFVAEVRLSYDALQDSTEGGRNVRGNQFENTVLMLMAGQLAIDIEEILLLSDTGSATTDYTAFNGWLKLAQDTNSYNHSGAAVNKAFFKNVLLTMPKAYRRNKQALRFFISPNMDVEWADEQADRVTITGDAVPWGDKQPTRAYGIPTVAVGSMPEESGSSSNLGKVLLTHPKNIVAGIWRNIFLEMDRDIRTRELIIVATVRIVPQFEQVEGTVVGQNVKIA